MNPTPRNKPPANALPREKNLSLFADLADRRGINPPTTAIARMAINETTFTVTISTKIGPNSANDATATNSSDYRVGTTFEDPGFQSDNICTRCIGAPRQRTKKTWIDCQESRSMIENGGRYTTEFTNGRRLDSTEHKRRTFNGIPP